MEAKKWSAPEKPAAKHVELRLPLGADPGKRLEMLRAKLMRMRRDEGVRDFNALHGSAWGEITTTIIPTTGGDFLSEEAYKIKVAQLLEQLKARLSRPRPEPRPVQRFPRLA